VRYTKRCTEVTYYYVDRQHKCQFYVKRNQTGAMKTEINKCGDRSEWCQQMSIFQNLTTAQPIKTFFKTNGVMTIVNMKRERYHSVSYTLLSFCLSYAGDISRKRNFKSTDCRSDNTATHIAHAHLSPQNEKRRLNSSIG
jgi:hypothetical protein